MNDQGSQDRFCARVFGRVQGVGFRWFVKLEADELSVVGTVRNMRDGSVEVWAEGEQEGLVQMLGRIACGPTHGRVDTMHVDWDAAAGRWDDFSIIT